MQFIVVKKGEIEVIICLRDPNQSC